MKTGPESDGGGGSHRTEKVPKQWQEGQSCSQELTAEGRGQMCRSGDRTRPGSGWRTVGGVGGGAPSCFHRKEVEGICSFSSCFEQGSRSIDIRARWNPCVGPGARECCDVCPRAERTLTHLTLVFFPGKRRGWRDTVAASKKHGD